LKWNKLNPHAAEKVFNVLPFHVDEERDYLFNLVKYFNLLKLNQFKKIVTQIIHKPEKIVPHEK